VKVLLTADFQQYAKQNNKLQTLIVFESLSIDRFATSRADARRGSGGVYARYFIKNGPVVVAVFTHR
jgi:hypothetical protein